MGNCHLDDIGTVEAVETVSANNTCLNTDDGAAVEHVVAIAGNVILQRVHQLIQVLESSSFGALQHTFNQKPRPFSSFVFSLEFRFLSRLSFFPLALCLSITLFVCLFLSFSASLSLSPFDQSTHT